jgi:hypothetical protein
MATAVAFSTFRDSSATGATGAFPIMSLSVEKTTWKGDIRSGKVCGPAT